MTNNINGTIFAGCAPALEPSFPAHAPAWAPGTDATSPKRRRSGRFVLLTAISFMLCLATFSAHATSTRDQLGEEIAQARTLLESAVVSANGWDVPIETPWATTATAEKFQTEITLAQAVYDGALKLDYDNDLLRLNTAKVQFRDYGFNDSGLKYDYMTLEQAIADAEAAISPANFAVSLNNGLDVPGTKKWGTQAALNIFKQQIKDARDVMVQYGGHGQLKAAAIVNQAAINAAATLLGITQLPAFTASLQSGYMPDYSDLIVAIANAQNKLQTTAVSVDGMDLPATANWTSSTVWNTLNSAVTYAQTFVDTNAGATVTNLALNQADVDTEESVLLNAINTFLLSVGIGSGSPLLYNYLVLDAAIADARAALASITSAATGDNISPDDFWTTPANWNALNVLIVPADGLHSYGNAGPDPGTVSTNQGIINDAADDLTLATTTLRSSTQSGCKPDYSQLNGLLLTVLTTMDVTEESLDGHEYDGTDFWALPADLAAMQNAVTVAQNHADYNDLAAHGNWAANQNAVDEAYAELNDAYTLFLTQRNPGDAHDPTHADFTNLPALILSAENLLDSDGDGTADVVGSMMSGNDVAYGTKWIAIGLHTPLTTHLAGARSIVNTPASFTKTHISSTNSSLSAAITAAGSAQMGLGANPAELADEIAAADPLLARLDAGEIQLSTDGTDKIYGTWWVTTQVANALNSARTNAVTTTAAPPQLHTSTIVPLESALRSATSAFVPQQNPPSAAQPDMTVLTDECTRITGILDGLASSVNGGADVPTGTMWVPSNDLTTLQNDIATALAAPYGFHDEVIAVIDNLNGSLAALLASQAPGTKPSYILATGQDLPDGFVGAVYNAQLVDATLPNVAFTVSSGALPDGLSLDASPTGTPAAGTGKLAGTPTRAGTFGFTIEATHNSMVPAVTETLPHTVKIYNAPAVVPTEYDYLETDLVSVRSDIVIHFPSGVPMDTTIFGTITLNDQPYGGYWVTDTTFVIPHPRGDYNYDTDHVLVVSGLTSKDGLLTYGYRYAFRTGATPPDPTVPRSVTLLPLAEGVVSDPLPGHYWVGAAENYSFTLKLTVPEDKTPTLTTNRTINGAPETVTGVPDPEMPETRFLFTVRQIHQTIEIGVALSPRSVGNEIIGDGVRIWASGGKLYVETPQPGLLSVYSITGVMHDRRTVVGSSAISLPGGIYTVRLNEKTYKIAMP